MAEGGIVGGSNTSQATSSPAASASNAQVRTTVPANVLDAPFIRVTVTTTHADYPAWSSPVTFTFRRAGTQWETVGLDRTGL
jgi:hypothetical protein